MAALSRYLGWQLSSRLKAEILFPWVDGARLLVRRGMTGATGNIYCGLHEFPEMGFLIHLLRPGDKFLDVGANIGSYSILASKVCGAMSVAFEPDPGTAAALRKNISLNQIDGLVDVKLLAVGDRDGQIEFTVGLDTTNRVATSGDKTIRTVDVRRLDGITEAANPTLIKLDVEGFEGEVVAGARNLLASDSLLAIQTEFEDPEMRQILASHDFQRVFYDPFSRKLSPTSLGYQVSNAIFVRQPAEVVRRLESAASRVIGGVTF